MRSYALPGQDRTEEPEWVVWLTVLLSLIMGWVLMTMVVGKTEVVNTGAGTLTIPQSWIKTHEEGTVFSATDMNAGPGGSRISIRQVPKADVITVQGADTLEAAASNWSLLRSKDLEGFRILDIKSVKLQANGTIMENAAPEAAGTPAMLVEYAYLANPPETVGANVMPVLYHAIDTVIARNNQFEVLTVAVDAASDASLNSFHRDILKSWKPQ